MSRLVLLERKHHQDLHVDTSKQHLHGADQTMMPVVLSEFQRCAIHFPIIFSKNVDTGAFVCTAVFGFEKGENLFWKEGAWDALYTPLNIQRQPFFLGNRNQHKDSTADDFVICIDQQSACLNNEKKGEAMFADSGESSAFLKQAQSTLGELLRGEAETKRFVEKMLELDLVKPLTLEITFKSGELQRVEGAYSVDDERLANLNDKQVLELHSAGYLGAIHTMFVSLGQLYPLIERKNTEIEAADSWFKSAESKLRR